MDIRKMGTLISSQRKEKNMTQKELADILKVTDKAVSKWERGLSYPDISLIVPLAEALDITTTQLLKGEKGKEEDAKEAVLETISYAKRTFGKNLRKKEHMIIGILSLTCVVAMFVCLLCNGVINHKLSWSLIVIGGTLLAWGMIVPVIKYKGKGVLIGLCVISIGILPYLYLIETHSVKAGWFFPVAMPITMVSIVFLWANYGIFKLKRISVWNKFAVLCFMTGCMTLVINLIARSYCHQTWFTLDVFCNVLVEGFLAMVLVVFGQTTKNKTLLNKITQEKTEETNEEVSLSERRV